MWRHYGRCANETNRSEIRPRLFTADQKQVRVNAAFVG